MEDKKEKKLYPGDVGYPGGHFTTEIHAGGKNVRLHIIKDAYGNVVSIYEEPLIFGIF